MGCEGKPKRGAEEPTRESRYATVAQRRMGAHILEHCLAGPMRKTVAKMDTTLPKEYISTNP